MLISEKIVNDQLDYISKIKSKNERLAWKRKHEKLLKIINGEMRTLDDSIINLMEQKQVFVDEIVELRKQMIKECVHPKEQLVHNGISITCKFCNVVMSLPAISESSEDE